MLHNEASLARLGIRTAENGTSKVWVTYRLDEINTYVYQCDAGVGERISLPDARSVEHLACAEVLKELRATGTLVIMGSN